jgi:hypothetical protein
LTFFDVEGELLGVRRLSESATSIRGVFPGGAVLVSRNRPRGRQDQGPWRDSLDLATIAGTEPAVRLGTLPGMDWYLDMPQGLLPRPVPLGNRSTYDVSGSRIVAARGDTREIRLIDLDGSSTVLHSPLLRRARTREVIDAVREECIGCSDPLRS